jgi:hypothetical protein
VARLLPTILIAAFVVVLAACQTASPSGSPTSTPAATPTQASTPEPTEAATEEQPTDGTSPGLPNFNADPALEDQLPDEIRGTTLTKFSFRAADVLDEGAVDEETQRFLETITAMGASLDDVSLAVAADMSGGLNVQLIAFKVAGANADQLLAAIVAEAESDAGPGDQIGEANLGGKSVTTLLEASSSTEGTAYLYASGDTVYLAQSSDEALAGEVLAALP